MARNTRLEDLENYTGAAGTINMPVSGTGYNPYHTIYETYNEDTRDHIFGFASLNYEFTDWLKVMARMGTDLTMQGFLYYAPKNHPFIANGRIRDHSYTSRESNYDFLIMINRSLSEKLIFSLNMGGNIRGNINKHKGANGDNLSSNGIMNITNVTSISPILDAGIYEK